MKKLILSAAILLGSLSTFAAISPVQNSAVKEIRIAGEYTEIKITDLPAAIAEALKKSHPNAVITKAYVNESKQYKLELVTGDKSETILTDATGTIVKE
jgi:hypothetical protein